VFDNVSANNNIGWSWFVITFDEPASPPLLVTDITRVEAYPSVSDAEFFQEVALTAPDLYDGLVLQIQVVNKSIEIILKDG